MCAVEVADEEELQLSTEQQHLDDDEPEDGPTGTTTTTIYPMMSLELTGISAESRFEDSLLSGSHTMEVYGSMAVNNISLAKGTARNLGTWGNPSLKSAINWVSLDGGAPKMYDTQRAQTSSGPQYFFKDTKLCASNTYANCQGSWLYNNNVVQVPVRLGDAVRINFNFMEYDQLDDDQFCHGTITGVVGKNSAGKYYLKTSAGDSTPITSADGTADYNVWDGVYGGLIVIPTYTVHQHECTVYFQ